MEFKKVKELESIGFIREESTLPEHEGEIILRYYINNINVLNIYEEDEVLQCTHCFLNIKERYGQALHELLELNDIIFKAIDIIARD